MRVLARSMSLVTILASAGIALGQQQAEVPAEAVGVLQYLRGTWEFTGRVGDAKLSGTFTARWARGRYALITQDLLKAEGEATPVRSAGVIGWDPIRKKIAHFGFTSDNNIYVNRWNVTASGDWAGQLTGTREGKEFENEFKLSTDSDKFAITWADSEGIEAEFIYKKLPAPKQDAKKRQR